MKICLFTDTLGDLNGVTRFIQDMGALANEAAMQGEEVELHLVTSTAKTLPQADYIHNLPYVWRMPMPFYQELDLVYCGKKQIEQLLQAIRPDWVHISTPGPFGWRAKNIAQKMGFRLIGTYHTDFPAYLYDLSGLLTIKRYTDRIMARFYKDFEHVFSRSEAYREIMAHDIGLDYAKTSVLAPGTDLQKFHPRHRDPEVWNQYGLAGKRPKVLYVGRINVEKNIPFLVDVWQALREQFPQIQADLVLIGEGRYRKWADRLRAEHIYFLGPVVGETLSQLYASSELFIFPSVTDTLGQVVMEAQASGLGCLVSDVGGPQSLVDDQESGLVLKADDLDVWVQNLAEALQDPAQCKKWGKHAHRHLQQYDIRDSYTDFMAAHRNE
ncbi:glycosyltransferase family 1 protein [Thiomicrorhabdus sp.]|uniref:glycosyltransferase family 4 protein n=1 Tax=Thiomicrorhabdus sp. TaxID=2039724 RepID=UPI0029C625CC|nr:glycosyltransferase family 1 protein [Thiomicrorhabdus sp.]